MKDKGNNIISKIEAEDANRQRESAEKKARRKATKKLILSSLYPLIVIMLIICLIAIAISSVLHYINLFDGTIQEDDWSNLPFVADYSLATSTISPNGEISTGMSAQEIWDTVLENKGRIDKYLDSPEELKKLLNAELITQYVDTRPNPEEPIDWDAINNDPNSKQVQGIIKLKRESGNGEKSTMKYTDLETFQSYIDKYNETGSEEDKERAFSYFTLGIEEVPQNIANAGNGTDGTAKKIEKGATIMIPQGEGLGETYSYLDWQSINLESSFQYKLKEQAGVTFDKEGFGRINGRYVVATTTTFGAVGDYIDYYLEDGTVIPCIIGETISSTKPGVNSWGEQNGKNILKFLVDRETWMTPGYAPGGKAEKMHVNPGTNGFHMEWNQAPIKVTNGENYFDNPDFVTDKVAKVELNNKSSENIKMASLAKVDVNSNTKNQEGTNEGLAWPAHNKWSDQYTFDGYHGGRDLLCGNNATVNAAETGKVEKIIDQGEYGKIIVIRHENGYITRYGHVKTDIKEGTTVNKGEEIAKADGNHIFFATTQERDGEIKDIDPFEFKYIDGPNDLNGTLTIKHTDNEKNSGNSNSSYHEDLEEILSSETPRYYAKIASWSVKNETILTDDLDFKLGEEYTQSQDGDNQKFESSQLLMGSSYLDYQNLVGEYTMPLEYLLGFLFVGQGKQFVSDLADLVYNSEIDIAILDNLTVDTTVITDTYIKQIDLITDTNVNVEYSNPPIKDLTGKVIYEGESGSTTEHSDPPLEGVKYEPHKITRIVEVRTNTIDAGVAKADTWLMDSSRETVASVPKPIINKLDGDLDDIPNENIPDKPDKIDDIDYGELAEEFRQGVYDSYKSKYKYVETKITSIETKYFFSYREIKRNINNQVDVTNNVMSPAEILEKTDPNSSNPNFVTIFQKKENSKSASNIHSAEGWLLEMYEKNSSTANMVDLTKYLLNKSDGKDYNENIFVS